MSEKVGKSSCFLLQGKQVNFNKRDLFKGIKNSQNSIMSHRPLSATHKKEKNVVFKLRRPLSADTIFCNEMYQQEYENMNRNMYCEASKDHSSEIPDLPSSKILKSLLSESISHPWENTISTNFDTSSNESIDDSDKNINSKIKEINTKLESNPGVLAPGLKSKPPLPEKKKKTDLHLDIFPKDNIDSFDTDFKVNLENDAFLEDLEDTVVEKLDILNIDLSPNSNDSLSNTSFKNWLQENKNLMLETKLLENETDLSLQTVHKHQEELNESILNLEPLFSQPSTVSTTKPEPKKPKPKFYRTELPKNKKPQKEIKKPPKSILKQKKIPLKERKNQTEDKEQHEDQSWMSSTKHESFLEFLNKLEGLEENEESSRSRPLSQRSFLQDIPEHDEDKNVSSTCDEIASILEVLEKEDLKSQKSIESYKEIINTELSEAVTKQTNINSDTTSSSTSSLESANYNDFLTYLEEVDKNCAKTLQTAKERIKSVTKVTNSILNLDSIPKLEDLINLSQVDLSHHIVNLSLRLKERTSSISTLQCEISKLRSMVTSKSEEFEKILKNKLKQLKDEYEPAIKRHQKFIDQLIADKKALNKQCEGLINEMKVLEDRYNTNMKTIEQRHKIELQKAKDMHMAAEKLRREKWIEGKTQKIKEMTVKGLEPELQNLQARHQQEISDLRSIHKREIEELELRGARKTQQQCEQLRQQLSLEREQAVAHEREILRQRLEKLVESEEKSYQELRRRLQAEHSARLSECEDRISLINSEKDRGIEAAKSEFDDKLQTALRRHKQEMKNVRESCELEFEVWKNNFKKQQSLKVTEMESQMRELCKRERDREIETVIERLEREAEEMKEQIEQATENRIRRMKEKYESEIKDLEKTTVEYKEKYSETKEKLLFSEDNILNLKTSMKQLQNQLQNSKKITEELSMDKDKMKEQVKNEFMTEMKQMEEELKSLRNNREEEMQKIFAKVKLTVNHKDEVLKELTQNNANLQERCSMLENLLEQQRKDYLIK